MTEHLLTLSRTYRRLGKQAVTSANTPPAPAAQRMYDLFMQLNPKEREILAFVAKFKQVSTKQIKAAIYPGKSHDPQRRSVDHLVKYKLIAKVREPMRGGERGGAQMNVWQLGQQGRVMYGRGRGSSVVVDYHLLAICDVYIALLDAQAQKQLKLVNYATEPDSHLVIEGLKPDLYADLLIRQADNSGRPRKLFIEVDLGTERQKQVLDQVLAYKDAYEAETGTGGTFPYRVVFLAINAERAADIQYWMRRAKGLPDIFSVGTLDQVFEIITA